MLSPEDAAKILRAAGWVVVAPSRPEVRTYPSLERDAYRPIAVRRGWNGGTPLTSWLTPDEIKTCDDFAKAMRARLMARDASEKTA